MFSVLQTPTYGIFQVVDGKFFDVNGVGLVTSPLEESSTCFPLFLNKERGIYYRRGADAPLKHPGIINLEQGESKRGEAYSLFIGSFRGTKSLSHNRFTI